jgi:hypothetical protein
MAATILEKFYSLLKMGEPPYTKFLVGELLTAHWFDISAAQKDFGYTPSMDMTEAFARYRQSLRL